MREKTYLDNRFKCIKSALELILNLRQKHGSLKQTTDDTKKLISKVMFEANQFLNSDYLSNSDTEELNILYDKCLEIYKNMTIKTPMQIRLKEEISKYSPNKLSDAYNAVCEIYGERLCDMYEFSQDDAYWVLDQPGTIFCVNGSEFFLTMEEVKMLVDECVDYKTFEKWWFYNIDIANAQENCQNEEDKEKFHKINLWSWLYDAPRISEEELKKHTDEFLKYIDNLKIKNR